MNDLKRVELAARRAASKLDTNGYAIMLAFADELVERIEPTLSVSPVCYTLPYPR